MCCLSTALTRRAGSVFMELPVCCLSTALTRRAVFRTSFYGATSVA